MLNRVHFLAGNNSWNQFKTALASFRNQRGLDIFTVFFCGAFYWACLKSGLVYEASRP